MSLRVYLGLALENWTYGCVYPLGSSSLSLAVAEHFREKRADIHFTRKACGLLESCMFSKILGALDVHVHTDAER